MAGIKNNQVNLSIRIDKDVKKDADKLFNELGFSLSTAVNTFIKQSLRDRAIPFKIKLDDTDNNFNAETMDRIRKSIAQAENGELIFKSFEELEAYENE